MDPGEPVASRSRQSPARVVMAKVPFRPLSATLEARPGMNSPLIEARWNNKSYRASATAALTLSLETQPGRDCLFPACGRCC